MLDETALRPIALAPPRNLGDLDEKEIRSYFE
jgi:hypothetical protein